MICYNKSIVVVIEKQVEYPTPQDPYIIILLRQSITRSLSILSKTDSIPVGLAAKVNQKLPQPFQHIIHAHAETSVFIADTNTIHL